MNILMTSIIDLKHSQHNRPHQIIKYLSGNHDITVVSIYDWWKKEQGDLESYSKDFNFIFDKIEYEYLTNRRISPIFQEIFSKRKINNIIDTNEFDLHFNYNTLVSGYYASDRLKSIYDIADDLTGMIKTSPQIPLLLRPIGSYSGKKLIDKNIHKSKHVSLTTSSFRNVYSIPTSKSSIIPNGVDSNIFRDYGSTYKELFSLEGFVVGYVGVLREWVDFEPLFSILNDIETEINVVIVGKEGQFQKNINLAKKYGVENRVKFIGMIPYSLVPKYISSMDICLIPFSKSPVTENAVPLKLFEYMSCEKPVISTNLTGVKQIADDKVLLVSNAIELKKSIQQLYSDADLRKKMGLDGRKFVLDNYDWSHILKKLESLMLDVVTY